MTVNVHGASQLVENMPIDPGVLDIAQDGDEFVAAKSGDYVAAKNLAAVYKLADGGAGSVRVMVLHAKAPEGENLRGLAGLMLALAAGRFDPCGCDCDLGLRSEISASIA